MRAFNLRYLELKDKFIYPINRYDVEYGKLEHNTLKQKLLNKIKNIHDNQGSYIIELEKEDLIKGLIGDIEYFFTRSIVQYENLMQSEKLISPCWMIVSQYYFAYFSATTLLRFLCRGSLFLNKDEAKLISDIGTALLGSKISISQGNYIFEIKNASGMVGISEDEGYIEIRSSGKNGVHEQTWITMGNIIDEIIQLNIEKDSEEYVLLSSLKSMCRTFSSKFPSRLRNKVNYNPNYGYKSVLNEISCTSNSISDDEVLKKICEFDDNNLSEDYMIQNMYLYGRYIFLLIRKLYSEYFNRSNCNINFLRDKRSYLEQHGMNINEILNIERVK